jgi:acylphosphatase
MGMRYPVCRFTPGAMVMSLQGRRIVVHGRVQGVGFRYFVRRVGSRLGLGGDVRNCDDGTVEIEVEGDAKLLAAFIREVERGSSAAFVERLEIQDFPVRGRTHFQIEGW